VDAFSYLSVLLSIIVGLAVTQVLQGYRGLLLARRRVRLSAPVLIWSGLLLVIATQAWWASFGLRLKTEWDFVSFAAVLLQMVLLYMLAGLIIPDVPAGSTIDLREHFESHRRAFFGFLLALLASSVAKDVIVNHALPSALNLAFHGVLALTAAVGLWARSTRVQLALAIFAALGIMTYIALLFARLGS
jgi:hypothetical protein